MLARLIKNYLSEQTKGFHFAVGYFLLSYNDASRMLCKSE